MTPEGLVALLGAALAVFFAYFPGVKDWFDKLDSRWKPLLNAGLLLVLVLALVGLGCIGIVNYFACSWAGVMDAVLLWVYALVGNILGYQVLVRQFKQANRAK